MVFPNKMGVYSKYLRYYFIDRYFEYYLFILYYILFDYMNIFQFIILNLIFINLLFPLFFSSPSVATKFQLSLAALFLSLSPYLLPHP